MILTNSGVDFRCLLSHSLLDRVVFKRRHLPLLELPEEGLRLVLEGVELFTRLVLDLVAVQVATLLTSVDLGQFES